MAHSPATEKLVVMELCALVLTLFPVSSTQVYDQAKMPAREQCYCLHKLTSDLRSPVSAVFYLEKGKERILVVEQRGLVKKLTRDGVVLDIFMDIRDRVVTSESYGDSRGLLSIVLDPYYDTSKKVYVYYIRKFLNEDYAYVSTFKVTESERVDTNSEVFLLRIHQPFDGGNGGPMFFGDDGYLYIVTGDGGEKDDPKGNAQNKNSFHGKVLRLDVTSGQQDFTDKESGTAKLYGIPGTNPFINSTIARPELYALGIRNMWGCSQDTVNKKGGTGRIFCAETGTNKFDEINLIEAGANYGWNVRQGTACQMTNVAECRPLENERYPIYEFPHNKSHALVGGYVYRGRLFSYLYGIYTFADAVTGKTYLLEEKDQGTWDRSDWLQCHVDKCPSDAREAPLKHILAFGQDLKSELYLLMADEFLIGSKTGKMFALLPLKSDTTAPSCYSCLVVTVAMVFLWENIN